MHHTHDIIILGAGFGGVAAALLAAEAGCAVALIEETRWIGGQATSQGVAALDEHRYIESYGGSAHYMAFRRAVRARMAQRFGIKPASPAYNPGNAWVSGLCFLPSVAHEVLTEQLSIAFASAGVPCSLYTEATICSVTRSERHITSCSIQTKDGQTHTLEAPFVIDATELGDGLALAGLEWVTGAESQADTGEALAPASAAPHEVQSFTYGFAVEYCPGENHTIPKPADYERIRDSQPFTLTLHGDDGQPRPFRVFSDGPTGQPPFWTYRRLLDGSTTQPPVADIALINWNSNDYHDGSLLGGTPEIHALHRQAAKHVSLAFCYWMQTEMPRDDGGYGYPEFRLRPDVMGTADGLSMAPYIRESRRTRGLQRIVAEDILANHQPHARARVHADAVGIGWYHLDLHPAPGNPTSRYLPTKPFQIPLGALIPPDCDNLLCGNKNIATTHLSNGAYRLHPVEWQIGAAAAATAVQCLRERISPRQLWADSRAVVRLQQRLLAAGQPIAWMLGVPDEDPCWGTAQLILTHGALLESAPYAETLDVFLDRPLSIAERNALQLAWRQLRPETAFPAGETLRALCAALNTHPEET